MIPDDKPTIGERYVRATESKRLSVTLERPGDVDMLIAAGWVKDGLGTTLFRLRGEFDGLNRLELAQAANRLTARVLTLAAMPSLAGAREALGDFAVSLATRQRFMEPDDVVRSIAGHALDLWLDPLCPSCGGRGFNGGYGSPRMRCAACHESGQRALRFGGKTEASHQFGRALLNEMDRKTLYVEGRMRDFMRSWCA